MPDGMTFKENIENEKKKWKNMNGKQRLDYFKSYYLLPLIVVIVVIAIITDILLQTVILKKDMLLSGIVYNYMLEDEEIDAFEDGYIEFIGENPKKKEIGISCSGISQEDYTSLMVLQTNLGAQALDFVIFHESATDILADQEMYANLEEVLDADVLKQLEGKISNAVDSESNTEYPAIIDISDCAYAKKNFGGTKAYLAFAVNSKNKDQMTNLVKYLIQL